MTQVDLLSAPRWKAAQLGLPMPDSPHAVSACLPLWSHNIGYEEGDSAVIEKLQAAYPRFCLHPMVRQLREQTLQRNADRGLLFPSHTVAVRAIEYVSSRGGQTGTLVPIQDQPVCGVVVAEDDFGKLREYWQHAGEVVSSRMAEQLLHGGVIKFSETPSRELVKQRVADLQQADVTDVRLYPSGMAAMAAAWRIVRQRDPVHPSVQFGFPYVDTLKIQQRFQPADCRFFSRGSSADLNALAELLLHQKISAVFCETPANPLLICPDLIRLRQLADQYGFLLIVDDTLAACINLDVLPLADLVVTSLTKYFSGYGDVLAGSVTLNRRSVLYPQLSQWMNSDFQELLSDIDVDALEQNSRDVVSRVTTINHNAQVIAQRLSRHPAVEQVWHPSVHQQHEYHQLQRVGGGYGGLLSFVVRNPAGNTQAVFDHLAVCKGPNLGTYFTLCCPYTILAHYNELDAVEEFGVSRWLLRVSIGTEPVEELWLRFQTALQHVS